LTTQIKLLRVLEEKVIERVGANRTIPIDVRIITATNRDLRYLVEKGAFREEIFYQTGGNQSQAARILGVSQVTVWNRLKRYRIKAKYTA